MDSVCLLPGVASSPQISLGDPVFLSADSFGPEWEKAPHHLVVVSNKACRFAAAG